MSARPALVVLLCLSLLMPAAAPLAHAALAANGGAHANGEASGSAARAPGEGDCPGHRGATAMVPASDAAVVDDDWNCCQGDCACGCLPPTGAAVATDVTPPDDPAFPALIAHVRHTATMAVPVLLRPPIDG